ncbi:6662d144-370e-4387-9ad2-c32ee5c10848 [Thermothielavioides terrestris]|uniref:6662d144-370e-4387-9ad2-c32ee5c10848 n=1 Tax=Thermothielavioides terrestris TaxID=2587410 RepID=A0A446BPQ0_9PEZI|nr:6662d144-370e-4387-9ad2-c32ee5c10848 [Thermothielavioides terrestris]
MKGWHTAHDSRYEVPAQSVSVARSACPPAWHQTPAAAAATPRRGDTAPPDLIVITSWTGAAPEHVAKYTAAYNTLYPGVLMLLITTAVADLVLRLTAQKLAALVPAVAYLLSEAPATDPSRSLPPPFGPVPPLLPPPHRPRFSTRLLHAFSEGGARKAVLLARACQQRGSSASSGARSGPGDDRPAGGDAAGGELSDAAGVGKGVVSRV